jgi:hypothetical protein
MLISKGASVGEVVSIKLISGEEIIARLEEENTDYIKVSRPLTVSLGPQGLGMIPFVFLAQNDTMRLNMNHVMVLAAAKKDAADQYIQGTTGIALK